MSVSIRQAARGDAKLVLTYIRRLAEYEKLAHLVDATEAIIDEELFGAAPRAYCDLAFWDGEPAGFAVWFYNYSTFRGKAGIYLEDLYVDEAMRGRGIGKALFRHLARRCEAEGLLRLQWWVLNWNEPSIAFYKSMGALPQEDWTVYRLSDEALTRLAKS